MPKYAMHATKAVAYDSPDHIVPRGTKNDNSRNALFNRKFEGLFPGKQLAILDLGCAGGGFVKDCIDDGHQAVGVEGSDYSKKIKRAEWATIPENLFTADITVHYQITESGADNKENPAKFDLITGWELLEHIKGEDLPGLVENLRRHMKANSLCVFSIADFPDEVDGVVYHQSVHPREWWVEKFASLGLRDHPELVKYFDPDWIRGPLQGSQSFHVVLSLADAIVPAIPSQKPYTISDLISNTRFFLNQGLNHREDGGKALVYSIRCATEAEMTSKDPVLPHLRATAFFALGDRGRATQAVSQALSIDPDFGPARRFASLLGMPVPKLSPSRAGPPLPPADRLLTLLFGARNDSYMGDFKYRFSTCLDLLTRNLKALGRMQDVEVLVVDWNSDVPLHAELPLSDDARQIVRFIQVPPDTARPAQLDSPFPIPVVQNVAIRRARGKYIAQTDSDILFTRAALENLFRVLEGTYPELPVSQSLLVASRRHLPFQQVLRKPGLDELDAYLSRSAAIFPREDFFPGFATPSAMALLHRDLWQACGGYDERLIYWGWMEIDLYLRLTQQLPWFDIASYGVNLVHIEHYTSPRSTAKNSRRMNPTTSPMSFEANDANWGLADIDLPQTTGTVVKSAESAIRPIDTAESIQKAMIDTSHQQFIQQFAQATRLGGEQINVFLPLVWYARDRFPRTYVDVGARYAATSAIVAAACPGVEIYAIDSWQDASGGNTPPIWSASNTIAQFGRKQNYVRFVSGNPDTAVSRLFSAPSAPGSIDLALIRTSPKFGNAVENALALAGKLAPGGAIVVSTRVQAEFDHVWNALLKAHPNWVIALIKANPGDTLNGLMLKPA